MRVYVNFLELSFFDLIVDHILLLRIRTLKIIIIPCYERTARGSFH